MRENGSVPYHVTIALIESKTPLKDADIIFMAGRNFSNRDNPDWYNLSIDVVSLYDSLHHNIILEALRNAFAERLPDWAHGITSWLIDLIIHTCDYTVLKSGNSRVPRFPGRDFVGGGKRRFCPQKTMAPFVWL